MDKVQKPNNSACHTQSSEFFRFCNLKVHVRILQTYNLQSQLRIFIDVIISLSITTCFGPYGPSSSEYNYYLKHLRESYHYPNGSVVHKFVTYYIEGKYVVI
jgi:hypothetical protein